MDRDRILAIVDGAYVARQRGDKADMARFWAPDAVFRIVGTASLLGAAPLGPGAAAPTVEQLIDMFRFHHVERIDAVVEGNRAAVRSRLTVSAGGDPLDTELFDLIEVNEDGLIVSMIQFTDTMTIASLLA